MKVVSFSADSDDLGTVTLSLTYEEPGAYPPNVEYLTKRFDFQPEHAAKVAGELLAASEGER